MEFTIVSLSTPPIPLVGSQFLWVSDSFTDAVMIRASAAGQPVIGTIGSLQCSTYQEAQHFKCTVPHNNCNCQPQEDGVSCTCQDGILEHLFEDKEHRIPLVTQGLFIEPGEIFDPGLVAEYEHHVSLELQISIKNLQLTSKIERNICKVTPLSFQGCYKCITGAKFKFKCSTDFGESLALISCTIVEFSTVRQYDGKVTTKTLALKKGAVNSTCSVRCSGGITNFQLQGKLKFLGSKRLFNVTSMITRKYVESEGVDFGFLDIFTNWSGTFGMIKTIIILIVLTIGIVLLVIFTYPLWPRFAMIITKVTGNLFMNLLNMFHHFKEFPTNVKERIMKQKTTIQTMFNRQIKKGD